MEMEPITAKKFMLDHWERYQKDIGVKSRQELLELLNIFQAAGTSLENVYEEWQNGYSPIMDITGRWNSGTELMKSIRDFNDFFTESEFIDFMLEQIQELKDEDCDDPAEEIRRWTYDDMISDTKIYKTEDGYVRRMWY